MKTSLTKSVTSLLVALALALAGVLGIAAIKFITDTPSSNQHVLFTMLYDSESNSIIWSRLGEFNEPSVCTSAAEKLREASTQYYSVMKLALPDSVFPYACIPKN